MVIVWQICVFYLKLKNLCFHKRLKSGIKILLSTGVIQLHCIFRIIFQMFMEFGVVYCTTDFIKSLGAIQVFIFIRCIIHLHNSFIARQGRLLFSQIGCKRIKNNYKW